MTKPYYQDEYVTLYHGDNREILPHLIRHGFRADVTITDPPYEQQAHTKGRRVKRRGICDGQQIESRYALSYEVLAFDAITHHERRTISACIAQCTRRWALVFCQIEATHFWASCFTRVRWDYVRSCIWVKPDGIPQYSGDRPSNGGHEAFVVCHPKGAKQWNGGGKHGVYIYSKNSGGKHVHQTQKPLPLMQQLVADFSNSDELLLDPFAGSGSTGVAAKMLRRRAVLIERDTSYCAIAAKRLRETQPMMDIVVEMPTMQEMPL